MRMSTPWRSTRRSRCRVRMPVRPCAWVARATRRRASGGLRGCHRPSASVRASTSDRPTRSSTREAAEAEAGAGRGGASGVRFMGAPPVGLAVPHTRTRGALAMAQHPYGCDRAGGSGCVVQLEKQLCERCAECFDTAFQKLGHSSIFISHHHISALLQPYGARLAVSITSA